MRTWEYLVEGHEVKNLRAFLYRVANNLIIDDSRKKKEASLEDIVAEGLEFASRAQTELQHGAEACELLIFLDKLEPPHRELILMRYLDDLSPGEIAEAIGTTENNVSVRLHRAIRKARELLSDQRTNQINHLNVSLARPER